MVKKTKREFPPFKDYLLEQLKDPKDAQIYLDVAMEEYEQDGNMEAFLLALRNVAKAQGGISKLSRETDLARESLYRTLSANGNPRLDTLSLILKQLGLRLSVRLSDRG